MKRFVCIGLVAIVFLTISGCDVTKEVQSSPTATALEETQPMDPFYSTVTITGDQMKVPINGRETFAFDGTALTSDDLNNFRSIAGRFLSLLKANRIMAGNDTRITIHFTDEVPQAIIWFEYYVNEDGQFVYASPKDMATGEGAIAHTVEKVNESTVLDLGFRQDIALSSTNQYSHRCIRIVCEYKDRKVEHLIVYDPPVLIAPTD